MVYQIIFESTLSYESLMKLKKKIIFNIKKLSNKDKYGPTITRNEIGYACRAHTIVYVHITICTANTKTTRSKYNKIIKRIK